MKQFGLIGDPIDHSLSPKMFKAAYGGAYPYKLIERKGFEASWKRFIEAYDGINITAPYKELALEKVGIVTPECIRIGATNLVLKNSGTTVAYNSDYRGVKQMMEQISIQDEIDFKGKNALIIGCGGAGKAAAVAMIDLGMNISLLNRTQEKAEEFCRHLNRNYENIPPVTIAGLDDTVRGFDWADVIVYTLPRPIPQLYDIRRLPRRTEKKLIIEANYRKPSFDKILLKEIIESGRRCEYVSGRQWLAYQAYTGYGLFTGETPDLETILSVF